MGTPQAKRKARDGTDWKTVVPWIAGAVVLGVLIVLGLRWYAYWFCGYGHLAREGWCKSFQISPPWTLFTALISGPALILTWYWREKHKREDLRIATEGQVTERFTSAVEQLGHGQMAVRLGAIYALERIANDSPCDHWTIMETLAAFVRASAPWKELPPGERDPAGTQAILAAREDVKTALSVLGRRNRTEERPDERVDLHKTDLRFTSLVDAHLERAHIYDAHLDGAVLRGIHLEEALLYKTHFEEANMSDARLERAIMDGAHLEGANLRAAHLEKARLSEANLSWTDLRNANLYEADLRRACLRRAWLTGALIEGVSLYKANLEGAILEGSVGLTRDQLAHAVLDADTKLPPEFADLIPERKLPTDEPPDTTDAPPMEEPADRPPSPGA